MPLLRCGLFMLPRIETGHCQRVRQWGPLAAAAIAAGFWDRPQVLGEPVRNGMLLQDVCCGIFDLSSLQDNHLLQRQHSATGHPTKGAVSPLWTDSLHATSDQQRAASQGMRADMDDQLGLKLDKQDGNLGRFVQKTALIALRVSPPGEGGGGGGGMRDVSRTPSNAAAAMPEDCHIQAIGCSIHMTDPAALWQPFSTPHGIQSLSICLVMQALVCCACCRHCELHREEAVMQSRPSSPSDLGQSACMCLCRRWRAGRDAAGSVGQSH